MRLIDLFEKDSNLGKIIAAVKKAKMSLPFDAEHVIDNWQRANWSTSKLEKAYSGNGYEEMKNAIDTAFYPVRQVLRTVYGDTVPLYRGEKIYDQSKRENRILYSWTADASIAKQFSNTHVKYNELTDEQIKKAVDSYNKTGFTQIGNRRYLRDKEHPEYFLIYDKNRQVITDGDDLEEYLRNIQAQQRERNKEYSNAGQVIQANVPIDDIIWITNDLNSKEFICKYKPY